MGNDLTFGQVLGIMLIASCGYICWSIGVAIYCEHKAQVRQKEGEK